MTAPLWPGTFTRDLPQPIRSARSRGGESEDVLGPEVGEDLVEHAWQGLLTGELEESSAAHLGKTAERLEGRISRSVFVQTPLGMPLE